MIMDARPSPRSLKRARGCGPGFQRALGLLLGVGLLLPACSDNTGPVGPSGQQGQVSTVGQADNPAQIRIVVTANPASAEPGRRVAVTVIVTNFNGFPLPGRSVTVFATGGGTFGGTVDQPNGTTDANGIYQTTVIVRCADAGVVTTGGTGGSATASVLINATVNGAVSAAPATITVTPTSDNAPCPGSA